MIVLCYFCFTVPHLKVNLLNGSPRVLGSNVYAEFSSNKPASIRCTLDGSSEDCESFHYNKWYQSKNRAVVVISTLISNFTVIRF